jgi:hypothetical protein
MSSLISKWEASVAADASIKNNLIDARDRLLRMEKEQLEIPELKFSPVGIRELFALVYSRR